MIYLKSPEEIEVMRQANRIAVRVMQTLKEKMTPGTATQELDRLAEEIITRAGGKPAFKGYRGFPAALCISINEELVHGIPSQRKLKEGDIVSIDCGVLYRGFYGDHAWTFPLGEVSEGAKRILAVGAKALELGIQKMRAGARLYDISAVVQGLVEKAGFSVVRDFVGHGIGKDLHEDPQLPNFGEAGTGMRLKPGLVLAFEPMVCEGDYAVKTLSDGWTVVTQDGGLAVHFEHSVAVTAEGPDVLSRWD
ncbi:MAG: type I methionyl aminopeptidase [Deltaproteobacteria bacterium]|nr:type I methionyl aminopeptidase [Deltaproteobacteria bacterium]MBI4224080.1 type I methionyl aminopeptidase [Deltaproteobacteria bacterium]